MREAGSHVFRVHPQYKEYGKQKRVFDCKLYAEDGGKRDDDAVFSINVLAKTVELAQRRFLEHLETIRSALEARGHRFSSDSPNVRCAFLAYKESSIPTRVDVTLATQLSVDRIHLLPRLLQAWKGPMSVAVYIAETEVHQLLAALSEYDAVLQAYSSPLLIHLVFREGDFYPVNYLRNVAANAVSTGFVFPMDVDFLPNEDMYKQLTGMTRREGFFESKTAFIVPAFETDDYIFQPPASRGELAERVRRGDLRPFRSKEWPQGHNLTQYELWYKSDESFPTFSTPDSEPYVVLQTSLLPK